MSEELVPSSGGPAAVTRSAGADSESSVPAIHLQRLFELAVQKGPEGVEALERLVALQAQVEARQAEREFAAAFARFKAQCPPIPRRTENQQFKVTRNGGSSYRMYASLEDIEETTRPHLGANGLSYRFGSGKLEGDVLTVPCIVSHSGGHSVESSVQVPITSNAGSSPQQKMGSAITYAQRYSLVAALGLTSCDEDTDGNEEVEHVTPEQVLILEALIGKRPDGARAAFLEWTGERYGADTMEKIPASVFQEIKEGLERKIAKGAR